MAEGWKNYRVVESHIIIVQLQGEDLGIQIVDNQVEDFIVLRILGVPDCLGALLPVPHSQIDIRVHFAQQISTSSDVLHFLDLQKSQTVILAACRALKKGP